ncbi:PEP-CTERM system TPR-repeat protein PrsT [Bowmanella sp. Y26]|uniref:XrtA/PEP-CTERM system TPR-repeat protein PrsT n=1 Tax=Bowmanella yangjiangensis TaxID=2811230 RepID=UPI001BDC4915|nr:PEP-CTERM system TPR-repeat protein PrsT [Bowmanella yangjiangensis]
MRRTLIASLVLGSLLACSPKDSDSYLSAARDALAKGDTQAAVLQLKNAVQVAPQNAQARFELGKLYLEQRQYQDAEKELNRAMEYGHPAAEVVPLLSRSYQKTGADVALSKLANRYAGLSEAEAAEVGFYRLESMVRLDQKEKARSLIEEIKNYQTKSPFKSLALVYGFLLEENIEAAKIQLDDILSATPAQPDALKLKARLQLQKGEVSEAIATYQAYHEANPQDHEITFMLARLLTDNGRAKEAEPLVDALLKLSKDNPRLNQLKGLSRADAGDFEAAQAYTEKALLKETTDPAMRLTAGFAAYQSGDYEGARTHLSLVASDLPPNHPALRLLAAAQLKLGLTDQAEETLSKLEGTNEDDASLFSAAGFGLLREGNLQAAQAMIEKSEQVSHSALDLTRLGILQLSMNDVDGILNLEQALEQAPDQEVTRTTLATAYLATKQYDKALSLAADWKKQEPESEQGYLLAATAYQRKGEKDKAMAELQQAKALSPDNPKVRLALIDIQLVDKQYEEGGKELAAFLQDYPDNIAALSRYFDLTHVQQQGEKGLAKIKLAFDKQPQNMSLRLLLANAYMILGQRQDTIALLAAVKDEDDKALSGAYWDLLGKAYLQSDKVVDAEAHYDRWLKAQPGNTRAILGKLFLLDVRSNFDQGLTLAKSMLESYPDDVRFLQIYTHFLLMKGNYAEGRKQFDTLPAALKSTPTGKGMLGRLLAGEGDCQNALPNILEAYESKQNQRNLTLALFCYNRLGQKDQAYQMLNQHVGQNDRDLPAIMLLAEQELSRDKGKAIDLYKKSLALHEANYLVLNNLAYLLFEQNKLDEAEKFAKRAIELNPTEPSVLDTAAQILIAKKEMAQAETYLEQAVNSEAVTDEVYLNYVDLLIKRGKKELAKRRLAQREYKQEGAQERADKLAGQL